MLRHYLLLSLKVLARRKFFTAISVFGISFTLMVLMVATALLDHAFGPGRPELKRDRILVVANLAAFGPHTRSNTRPGYAVLDRYARNLPGASVVSFFRGSDDQVPVYSNGQKVEPFIKHTDANFWRVYDFAFVDGRPYTQAEFDGGRRVAVLNRTTGGRLFGSGPVLGRTFDLDGQTFEVIGIVEDVSFFRFEPFSDIWIPYSTQPPAAYRDQFFGSFNAAALADDAAGMDKLHDEFNSRMTRAEVPEGYTTVVAPFETRFDRFARNGPFRDPENPEPQGWKLQLTLLVIAGLFTVIPIVNLVNLNVSRIMERSSEIGVRKAFGAPALTLVGQFVVENVLLTLIGGAAGLLLSIVVVQAINASGAIPYSQFTVNLRVFGFAILMSIVFGLMSGVYPAWRMSRLHPVDALKGVAR